MFKINKNRKKHQKRKRKRKPKKANKKNATPAQNPAWGVRACPRQPSQPIGAAQKKYPRITA
jgi:hypothetical protein